MHRLAVAALAASLAAVPGMLEDTRPREEPAARWTSADSAALDERISELEERLLAHQARVSFWEELKARHEGVSAVACQNLGSHAAAMHAAETRVRTQVASERRRRVASAAPLPTAE